MQRLIRQIATFLGFLSPPVYRYPAVDVELARKRQFHLVGSIHMGTVDMFPLPRDLLEQLEHATALVVEADISGHDSPFSALAAEPPLAGRLDSETHQRLEQLCQELSFDYENLDRVPAWQAALMLQARQAMMLGLRPDYGIDYQLINAARDKGIAIIELEGQQTQLELLQQLPQGGLSLLEDTLLHWHTNARLLQTMVSWWIDQKPMRANHVPTTFGNDLTQTLIQHRNERWQRQLAALPQGKYVVSVGALHLYGEHNLPELLQAVSATR
ncbi:MULTISPECIES: TraB/GumN family protein [Dickeya]|uniref:FIG00921183: possible ligase n=1 Tax=Dickeya aquatica TaxID=1401087 RepID=A0A375AD78_9GAMM|nr:MULTISPECIES: TraB/GumN family protein [Dickeya]SLM63947.1 FIG00921183: possible ligase [Dickeya aquatica]